MASSDRTAGFGPLEGSKTALLTTFRRGGESVGTPLSIAVTGGKAYFVTAADSGKATRLGHTARVTLAPCTVSGKVNGDTVTGRAPRARQGPAAPDRAAVLEPGRLPAVPRQADGAVRGRPRRRPGGRRRG